MTTAARHATPDLLDWLDAPRPDTGIHFAERRAGWAFVSYAELAESVRTAATTLSDWGACPHQGIALVLRSGRDFVTALFAGMVIGAPVSPIAPPLPMHRPEDYRHGLARQLQQLAPAIIVAEDDLAAVVAACAQQAGAATLRTHSVSQLRAGFVTSASQAVRAADDPEAMALVQFTSGSSSAARAVRVPRRALLANVDAIRRWLHWTELDPVASWLPLHHDMGLTGCLITPVVSQSPLWLMSPTDFVRNPARWIRLFGIDGARLAATPPFGLDYVLSRVREADLAGCDFTHWRAAILGAERIPAALLRDFAHRMGPYGFRSEALLPSYGLAESTLAVTGSPINEVWTLARDERDERTEIVGCGYPLDGSVWIQDPEGHPLPDGSVGEIVISGPSVARGYIGEDFPPGPASTSTSAPAVRTGDAGFLRSGQLFVIGRMGDSVKVRGRHVFAEDLDAELMDAGIPNGRAAVILGADARGAEALVVLERPEATWEHLVRTVLIPQIGDIPLVIVEDTIVRTTSGKPRRPEMWRMHKGSLISSRVAAPFLGGSVEASAPAACEGQAQQK